MAEPINRGMNEMRMNNSKLFGYITEIKQKIIAVEQKQKEFVLDAIESPIE